MQQYDPRLKLSQHFMLEELTRTDQRDFIDVNRNEAMFYYDNLARLCTELLEPVRLLTGPIFITSGFRCRALNKLIGGSMSSQHVMGEAADTHYNPGMELKEIFNTIAWSKVPYSQIILEFGSWIHIGAVDKVNYPGRVGQKMIAARANGVTTYYAVTKPLK